MERAVLSPDGLRRARRSRQPASRRRTRGRGGAGHAGRSAHRNGLRAWLTGLQQSLNAPGIQKVAPNGHLSRQTRGSGRLCWCCNLLAKA